MNIDKLQRALAIMNKGGANRERSLPNMTNCIFGRWPTPLRQAKSKSSKTSGFA